MQLHTVEWHYPQQPPPLHPLAYGDLEETSSVAVMLRNDAGALLHPPTPTPPATAILPLWSVTEDAALFVCTISSMKFDA